MSETSEKSDCVIFCAGRGNRLRPHTDLVPKPLLRLGENASQCALRLLLDAVLPKCNNVILVVGYLKKLIAKFVIDHFWDDRDRIHLVEQPEPLGTGHALLLGMCRVTTDRFFVVNGDDLYSSNLIRRFLDTSPKKNYVATFRVPDVRGFGEITETSEGINIVEKPEHSRAGYVNIGLYSFVHDDFCKKFTFSKSPRGEYEITDFLANLSERHSLRVRKFEADSAVPMYWLPINTIEQYDEAKEFLSEL